MTEAELYQKYIKKWLISQGVFYYRIEYARIPDVYTCKDGVVTWYELKVINKVPKSRELKPDWRPGQLAWIREHQMKGGDNVRLILWVIDKWYILEPREQYNMEDLQ